MLVVARLAVRFVPPARLFAWADRAAAPHPPLRGRGSELGFLGDRASWRRDTDERAGTAARAGRARHAAPARHRQPALPRRRARRRRTRGPCLGRGRQGQDRRRRRGRALHAPGRVRPAGSMNRAHSHERHRRTVALRRPAGERHELERAANALRQYGPDRSDIMASGSIGLVHVLMRMTPEDRFDRQPLRGASGALITADLRLDNRDDLLARIGVAPQDAAEWPDARVLLAGWEKFGDDVWPLLRGPFAAAIWDRAQPHVDAGARPARAQRGDVAPERTIFRLRHHAERPVRARRRAAPIERGEIRRFPRAQSRRPRQPPSTATCFAFRRRMS